MDQTDGCLDGYDARAARRRPAPAAAATGAGAVTLAAFAAAARAIVRFFDEHLRPT